MTMTDTQGADQAPPTCPLTINGKTRQLEAGVHELTMDEYLALEAISRTGLLQIHDDSPADYVYAQDHRDTSWSMDFGTAVHTAILEPHLFDKKYTQYPMRVNRSFKDEAKAAAKGVMTGPQADAFAAEHAGMTILPDGDTERAKYLARVVRARPVIANLLKAGHAERTLLWQKEGLWVKSRPDFWDPERALVVDVKTTRSTRRKILDYSIKDYGDDLQASIMFDGLAALGHRMPFGANRGGKSTTMYVWLWIRNDPKQRPDTVAERMSIDWLERGDRIYAEAFETYKHCMETGDWHGLPANVTSPDAPAYIQSQNASATWDEEDDNNPFDDED